MKRISISGSSGFVGVNLIPYLSKHNFNFDELGRKELASKINFEYAEAIIHLAGKAHDLRKTSNSDEYYKVNFELTKKLYDAFLKSGAKKFIFISSVKAAADSFDGILIEETTPNPQTHYGKSKLMAEEYIQRQQLPEGKSFYILRPCMIHGPGNKGNLNLLYNFVSKGIPYPLAAFKNRRSFLSIENLCFVILNVIQKEIPSGVYQVADDEALSTNEVVSIFAQSLNRQPKLWSISNKFIVWLAKIGDILSLPLNTERLNKMTENYIVSNKKIKNEISLAFPVTARKGLLITANSFKKN